jgi:hypothetical protein
MLSDIQFETQEIKYRGSSFTVRGLGLDIVSRLLASSSRAQIDAAVSQLEIAYKADGDSAALEGAVSKLAIELPELVAQVIAFAADEPDAAVVVARLPLPVQLEALMAIGRLTFDGEESIKNFVSGLVTLMTSVKRAVEIAGQTVTTGTQS